MEEHKRGQWKCCGVVHRIQFGKVAMSNTCHWIDEEDGGPSRHVRILKHINVGTEYATISPERMEPQCAACWEESDDND